jgi:hypothetical protein
MTAQQALEKREAALGEELHAICQTYAALDLSLQKRGVDVAATEPTRARAQSVAVPSRGEEKKEETRKKRSPSLFFRR